MKSNHNKKANIAVIVVGYNSREYLPDLFSSLVASVYQDFIVIFVNNGTEDGSLEYLKTHYPKTVVIPLSENRGPVHAYNVGTKRAIELGCSYIFLANHDTVLDKNCLAELWQLADQKTILQPLTLIHANGRKTNFINTTGGVLHFLGYSYCSDYRSVRQDVRGGVRGIPVASAVAELIPVSLIKKIGLFDEDFFMYHDDVDFSWRARIVGCSVKLMPSAMVWHKYSYGRNKIKLFYFERNRIVFMLKNYQLKTLLILGPALLTNELLMIIYALLTGWGKQKLRSYCAIFKSRSDILAERKRIQRLRTISDKQLYQYFSTQLSFSEVVAAGLPAYSYLLGLYWRIVRTL